MWIQLQLVESRVTVEDEDGVSERNKWLKKSSCMTIINIELRKRSNILKTSYSKLNTIFNFRFGAMVYKQQLCSCSARDAFINWSCSLDEIYSTRKNFMSESKENSKPFDSSGLSGNYRIRVTENSVRVSRALRNWFDQRFVSSSVDGCAW